MELQLKTPPFLSQASAYLSVVMAKNLLEGPEPLKTSPHQTGGKPETVVPAGSTGSIASFFEFSDGKESEGAWPGSFWDHHFLLFMA